MSLGHLFVISGPSGVGKSEILKRVRAARDGNLLFSVSATSRAARPGEVEGEHYFFVSKERFLEMISQDAFVEYDFHDNNYYGTLCSEVQRKSLEGNLVLDIEPNGAANLKRQFPDATLMFLVPPSMEELEHRLRNRKDTDEEQIAMRMERARWELEQLDGYDYVLTNDDLDTCVKQILHIIAQKADGMNMEE